MVNGPVQPRFWDNLIPLRGSLWSAHLEGLRASRRTAQARPSQRPSFETIGAQSGAPIS
jgi:hypothetical protein